MGGLCGCNYCGVFGFGVGIIRGSTVADDFMIALVSNVIRFFSLSPYIFLNSQAQSKVYYCGVAVWVL